jgi:putative hydrolase of the HAD superfamily
LPGINEHRPLNHFFHHHYYSHQVRKRKPEPEIFRQVLEENKFRAAETLFLDDNEENIMAAATLGIQTQLIQHPDHVMDYFNAL